MVPLIEFFLQLFFIPSGTKLPHDFELCWVQHLRHIGQGKVVKDDGICTHRQRAIQRINHQIQLVWSFPPLRFHYAALVFFPDFCKILLLMHHNGCHPSDDFHHSYDVICHFHMKAFLDGITMVGHGIHTGYYKALLLQHILYGL